MKMKFPSIYVLSFFLFALTVSAQEWELLGPDDNNQPTTVGVGDSALAADDNGSLYIAYAGGFGRPGVRKFDGSVWTPVGEPDFFDGRVENLDIKVNSNGNIYVAYTDTTNDDRVTVQWFNGDTWVALGNELISDGSVEYLSLDLDSRGRPYVLYTDDTVGTRATVKRFTGTAWELVGELGFTERRVLYAKLAIATNDIPYIVYSDVNNDFKATVRYFGGTSWETLGTSGFSSGIAYYTDIALDSSNRPYVIYRDEANDSKATVQRFNGTEWEMVGTAGFSNHEANFTKIGLDDSNLPYAIYADVDINSSGFNALSKPTVQRFNGTTWEVVGQSFELPSILSTVSTGIVFDDNGMPNVIFKNESGSTSSKAFVHRFNGNQWVQLGVKGITDSFVKNVSLSMDSNGIPHLAYSEIGEQGNAGVLRFNNGSWDSIGQLNLAISGSNASRGIVKILFNEANVPYILTNSGISSNSLEVQRFNGTTWEVVGDRVAFSGQRSGASFALDSSGNPYAAYSPQGGSSVIVRFFNGSNWETLEQINTLSRDARFVNIVLDTNDVPYVAYSNGLNGNAGKVVVQRFNGTTWEVVGERGFSDDNAWSVSLAISKSNVPYVYYKNSDNFSTSTPTVERYNGTAWEKLGTTTNSYLFGGTFMLDEQDTPFIFYFDIASLSSRVYKFDGTDWVPFVTDDSLLYGESKQIGIDNEGNLIIAYVNDWLFAKKLASSSNSNSNQDAFITTWKTDNPGISEDNQITIPTVPSEIYNYSIDWGDGSMDSNVTGDMVHTYAEPGTYQVSITGLFPRIFHDDFEGTNSDGDKLISVDQWGTNPWTSMYNAFMNCSNLDVVATDIPNLTNATSLGAMFRFCESLVGNASFENWDVSMITDFSVMFNGAKQFNQNIGGWDVSQGEELLFMFSDATLFNQDISGWDIRNANALDNMFASATSFNQPIGKWDISNVTSLRAVFAGAKAFDQDLSGWDVSNVLFMEGMFSGAENFNQDISNWNVGKVTTMSAMFANAISFNSPLNSWDTSSVVNLGAMFFKATMFNQPLNNWNVSSANSTNSMFEGAESFNQLLNKWDTSNVMSMISMFRNASAFDQDLGGWDVGNVTTMNVMFSGTGLSTTNYDSTLQGWSNLPFLQSGVDFNAGNSKYCESGLARQFMINTYSWIIQDNGEDILCNQDSDGDGVFDFKDLCVDSVAEATVDENGCDIIPNDAIKVLVLTPSCIGTTDGSITISMEIPGYRFDIEIDGETRVREFQGIFLNSDVTINNLSPGTYSVRVSIPDILFEQEYGVTVNALDAVSGRRSGVDPVSRSATYLVSGSTNYSVELNDRTFDFSFDSTAENTIELTNLKSSNTIRIKGQNDCQSIISDSFSMDDAFVLYPTITSRELNIDGLELGSEIKVFDMSGRLLLDTTTENSGEETLRLDGYESGMYVVQIKHEGETKSFKVFKR
ncbi:MAG: BspA family leucine-rich repeat surface protein [Bacteroidota bacterium]